MKTTSLQQSLGGLRAKGFAFHKFRFFSTQIGSLAAKTITTIHVAPAVMLAIAILNSTTSRAQVPVVPAIPPGTLQLACSEQALNGDYSVTLIGFNTVDVVKQNGYPRLTADLSQNLQQPANLANRTNDGVILGNITGMPSLQLSPRMSILLASFDGKGNVTSKEARVVDSTTATGAPPFSTVTKGSYTVASDCTITILIGPYGKYAVTGVLVDGGKKIHGIAFIGAESVQNTFVVEAERI